MLLREEAEQVIRRSQMAAFADRIISKLQPSVRITAARTTMDDIPLGASRFGGLPDLPDELPWPTWNLIEWTNDLENNDELIRVKHQEERALDFIAQIRMEDVQAVPFQKELPSTGTLYFFHARNRGFSGDPEATACSRVIYSDNHIVKRRSSPRNEAFPDSHPSKISFDFDWTIPNWASENYDFYFDYPDGYEVIIPLRDELASKKANIRHRLLGWADEVQDRLQLNCQLISNGICTVQGYMDPRIADLESGAKDWLLLLQVDSDEKNTGWWWGDGGTLYFMIHQNDLKNRRFDRVIAIDQCF